MTVAETLQRTGSRMKVQAASRIRRKLVLLHTLFSLSLAVILLIALRPAVGKLVGEAERREALLALEFARSGVSAPDLDGVILNEGDAERVGLPEALAQQVRDAAGEPFIRTGARGGATAAVWDASAGRFVVARVSSTGARAAVNELYLLLTVALLSVYALIAATLEVFVLPKQVYGPIERLRRADEAVQAGLRDAELIPERDIGSDELAEIMRSRNRSIVKLRDQEAQLNAALDEVERIAAELKRKNHLLETAKRNLADQDRLASLGIMSAGIAHELNTPLAVLKGSVERLNENPRSLDPQQAALMLRVVRRLERLSESLLDFARVRPPAMNEVDLRAVIDEAWTLVSIDRSHADVDFTNAVPPGSTIRGDADRLTQLFVNLLRNAVDAMDESGVGRALEVASEWVERDGESWAGLTVRDSGPGIAHAVLPRLFEPFASTRMDSHGTGLGLAVAEGIVREHGGVVVARNRTPPDTGAEFEGLLPAQGPPPPPPPPGPPRRPPPREQPRQGRGLPSSDRRQHQRGPIRERRRSPAGARRPVNQVVDAIPSLSIVALDDDADFRQYIEGVLAAEGHEIRVVATPDELYEANETRLPDVVLLDMKMGRHDGAQVLDEIRTRWENLCVVVVTGYPSLETMRNTFKQDVFDYLSKPFSVDELRATLRQAVETFGLGERPQDRLRQTLGRRIRLARTERGWTLKELSEASRVSVSQLSSIERGAHLPSLESLLSVAAALDAKPSAWLTAAGF